MKWVLFISTFSMIADDDRNIGDPVVAGVAGVFENAIECSVIGSATIQTIDASNDLTTVSMYTCAETKVEFADQIAKAQQILK